MLHFEAMHKFITDNNGIILIDGDYSIAEATKKARAKDKTARYIAIVII